MSYTLTAESQSGYRIPSLIFGGNDQDGDYVEFEVFLDGSTSVPEPSTLGLLGVGLLGLGFMRRKSRTA